MPHLSPLNWLFSPLLFWMLLIMMNTIIWWSQTPFFSPTMSAYNKPITYTWPW